jgi:hypothetical protein
MVRSPGMMSIAIELAVAVVAFAPAMAIVAIL